jgi:Cys-tRNA(Pro) deacylase
MKKNKTPKKKVPVKKAKNVKKVKALKKVKTAKKTKSPKKTAAKKVRILKKPKAVKKAPARKVKPLKKIKAVKKVKPPKKPSVKKAKAPKKTAVKKVKALKKVKAIKKAKAPTKAPVEKVKVPTTPAIQDLQKQKVKFTLHPYQYEEPGGTKQSASKLGVDEHIIIKTLITEDENGKPLIILMHGDKEVSTDALAAIIGAQTVSPCKPEVAEGHTGYQIGGTSPFGIQKVIPVFMERTIADLPNIYINAGQRGLLAQMSSAELINILKPFMVSVAR